MQVILHLLDLKHMHWGALLEGSQITRKLRILLLVARFLSLIEIDVVDLVVVKGRIRRRFHWLLDRLIPSFESWTDPPSPVLVV